MKISDHKGLLIFLCCLGSALSAGGVSAEPFIPKSDDVVLETLPRTLSGGDSPLADLSEWLADDPRNLTAASQLAREYITLGRRRSDPRYFGYAQAALAPWWDEPRPPPEVLLLRATLLQNRHEFEAALEDLNALLEIQPRNAQAWLTRAVVHQVTGDYQQAMRDCLNLAQLTGGVAPGICIGNVLAVSGHAGRAYDLLRQAALGARDPALQQWALTSMAQIKMRQGEVEAAARHFEQALQAGPRSPYLLRVYADFLLDRGRAEQVLKLLKDETRDDALLLRAAIAARDAGREALAKKYVAMLEDRFREARLRGDWRHVRDAALFELELQDDAEQALQYAARNWRLQKAPEDALMLLQAAVAANDLMAARPVIEWMKRYGIEDVRLQALLKNGKVE
ncbi:MAG: tetratricopeptide repeat protein [Nitrococcus sp.]|nr:tetratricopeptide repeat protein [Nitrococcus sp.]